MAVRVFIVDDSAVVRQVLSARLADEPGIEVAGTAADPVFALAKMANAWPDVIVLDVEMPRMDGITFLRKLMAERPTPVVICSTLTTTGAETTMQALAAGAVCVVAKPTAGLKDYLADASTDLVAAIRAAAGANIRRLAGAPAARRPPVAKLSADAVLPAPAGAMARTTDSIVAIGTSTGGTTALEHVLSALPRTCPGIVVVQHMPEKFTAAFAQRLDGLCRVEVKEAQDGDRVMPGRVLVAPGGRHMQITRNGAQYRAAVKDGPLVNRHRPSVDVLFRSVAAQAGRNALGIIMTGMGDDGARGLREMRDAGARTIAQDEASCVVFGMPREAVRRDAVERLLSLDGIAEAIVGFGAAGG